MNFCRNITAIGIAFSMAAPAAAATYSATNANLKSIFALVKAGDTIVLRGAVNAQLLRDRSFSKPVTINASGAVFNGKLVIQDVDNLRVVGVKMGSSKSNWQAGGSANVYGGSNISFINPVITADGSGRARGISFRDVNGVNVEGGTFTGLRMGVGMNSVTNATLTRNKINGATSDGFNIVSSHNVTATQNVCRGTNMSAGAHPDCMQLWSLEGSPAQSDIKLINNQAYGHTQGFTSFDPSRGGGLRIQMSDNRVETTMPQGVACYNCVDSIFTNNLLITAPGARFMTNMNIVGGSNNTIFGNTLGARPTQTAFSAMSAFDTAYDEMFAAETYEDLVALEAGWDYSTDFTSDWEFSDLDYAGLEAAKLGLAMAGVPEPGVWAQLIAGFALVGAATRRRRQLRTVAA